LSVQLVSKISSLCDPDPSTSQTDRQTDGRTTCNLNTALCTSASRGKNAIQIQNLTLFAEIQTSTRFMRFIAYINALLLNLTFIQKSPSEFAQAHIIWGFITVPITIPYPYPWESPCKPTAALQFANLAASQGPSHSMVHPNKRPLKILEKRERRAFPTFQGLPNF